MLSGDASAGVKADGERKVALLYVLDSVLKKCKFREESNRCGAEAVCACATFCCTSPSMAAHA